MRAVLPGESYRRAAPSLSNRKTYLATILRKFPLPLGEGARRAGLGAVALLSAKAGEGKLEGEGITDGRGGIS